jgi:hypothetical protein
MDNEYDVHDDFSCKCVVSYTDSIELEPVKKMFLMSCLQQKALFEGSNNNIFSWWSTEDTIYDIMLIWVSIATQIPLKQVFLPNSFIMDMSMYCHFVSCTGVVPYWFLEKKYVSSASTKPPQLYPRQRQKCQEEQQKILLGNTNIGGDDHLIPSPALENLRQRILATNISLGTSITNRETQMTTTTTTKSNDGVNIIPYDCLLNQSVNMHYYQNNPHYPLLFLVKCNAPNNSITFLPYHSGICYDDHKFHSKTTFEQLYKQKNNNMNVHATMTDYNATILPTYAPPTWLIFEQEQIDPRTTIARYKTDLSNVNNNKRQREGTNTFSHNNKDETFLEDNGGGGGEEEEENPKKKANIYLPGLLQVQQGQYSAHNNGIQNNIDNDDDTNMQVDHHIPLFSCSFPSSSFAVSYTF